MRQGKIRCDECVYWVGTMGVASGECHRHPPFACEGWPVVSHDEWCGDFKHPEIVEKETVEAERVIRGNMCDHQYPEVGCSKCMELFVSANPNGSLFLNSKSVIPPQPPSMEQIRNYKLVGDTVQKSGLCPRCFGMDCIACTPDKSKDKRRTSCLCGGVGCSSCEPGGRG